MNPNAHVDGVLVEWGERLFYPRNRIVKAHTPRLRPMQDRAAVIRSRIQATVRRAPQVMVKVTGGGRGMGAIAAHLRYITKNGRLDIEDDRGVVERGKDSLRETERQWRLGGAYIGQEGHRREAFNIMLSMPRLGSDDRRDELRSRGVSGRPSWIHKEPRPLIPCEPNGLAQATQRRDQ